jgi:transcription elongation factor GreB
MSRAFVKEDTDLPERSGRTRSASGLPPGALNYMTASGARRLRERLAKLRAGIADNSAEIARLERILASVTIVETPAVWPDSVALGAKVTLRAADGQMETCRIVGVDELEFEDDAVSWISPLGKALLGAEVGERVRVEGDDRTMTIVKMEYGDPVE